LDIPRYISALILGFVVTAALAGDDDPVKQPYVEGGDCWTYRVTSSLKQDKVGNYNLCVTYVDKVKNVILAVRTSFGGREIDETFSAEWNPVTNAKAVRPSGTHFLKFPLHVGDTYSFEADSEHMDSPEQERKRRWDMKVVGWEDVTVPAGTFHAVRIEGIGINAKRRSPNQKTIWYVPEVNRDVKTISVQRSGTFVHELTQYRLNK
jgi:hypothetical protein